MINSDTSSEAEARLAASPKTYRNKPKRREILKGRCIFEKEASRNEEAKKASSIDRTCVAVAEFLIILEADSLECPMQVARASPQYHTWIELLILRESPCFEMTQKQEIILRI